MPPTRARPISFDTFCTGILATCVRDGITTLSCDEPALTQAFRGAASALIDCGIPLQFRIRPTLHGSSETVSDGLNAAIQRGLLVRPSGTAELRLTLTPEHATELLDHLPIDRELFLILTTHFRSITLAKGPR